ncbi:imidazolonepropionase [Mariniplasma anaerobium]|uniref:Imidazolonepropionase n=2 Tax=Mariniplasma anaerobium TaxID=2735436 RepID=A0A7U9THF3_9MOLU|nr:imidazolonepropionase [Mariniplasma anaerobium]
MIADLIIYNIRKLYTSTEKAPVKGYSMGRINMISNAFVAVKDGKILDVNSGDFKNYINFSTKLIDANHKICLPGFIDSHTHLVHAGSREDEFEKLKKGVPYLEILKNGGGILGTVDKTRHATFEQLFDQAYKSLDTMLTFGVTTIEGKSGYGLCLETELKQLKVMYELNRKHPIDIISTYMGAHAVPREYEHNKKSYIEKMKEDLVYIKSSNLTNYVDVFCETGVFDIEESKDILKSALDLGFKIKLHADEIDPLGGAGLGVELGATSVDHLMAISPKDIKVLAQSNTIANILPGTSFYLNKPFANARAMIDQGCALSISSDYNPGSCPTENFQLICQLSANHLKMSPEEILNAVTVNAAYHLGLSENTGTLEIGKDADIILLDIPNLAYMFYHFGINHVTDVIKKGKVVVKNKTIQRGRK